MTVEPARRSRSVERYGIPCTPPRWARGGHAQTLVGHLLPSTGRRFSKESSGMAHREVLLSDGDRLLVYETPGKSGVRVHLFHGLSGDANAEYMRRTARSMSARGHDVWVANHRGCGEGRGLAARPYHSGRSEDLRAVLAESRRDAPDRAHIVIGFSLSGNAALLLAAAGREHLPDGIIAVNPPVDLQRASVAIGRGLNRIYEVRFMWRLRREVRYRERAGFTRGKYSIPLNMSLCEFDDAFTAPEAGFDDGADYYRKCSSLPRLPAVAVPSVIVAAADDPFVDPAVYEAHSSDSVFLHVERHGGHVGYVARQGIGWTRWLDGALEHYVDQLVAASSGLAGARCGRSLFSSRISAGSRSHRTRPRP